MASPTSSGSAKSNDPDRLSLNLKRVADPGLAEYSPGGESLCSNLGVLEMRGVAFVVFLDLIACAVGDAATPANASSEMRGWQTAAGKPPSKTEFAAVVAACEDRAKTANKSDPIEGCLADFGLHRVQ
jgi:hypothetical protein